MLALFESVPQQRWQGRPCHQPLSEPVDLPAPCLDVLAGQGDISAVQWLALDVISESFEGPMPGSFAQGLGWVVDAGDVRAGVDGGIVALHDPLQTAVVEGDGAPVARLLSEVLQAARGLGRGWAGQASVLVDVDDRPEVLAASEGLLAFDLGAEAGVAGA